MKVRLRFNADLYTGLTVSDARNALFNWLLRHHHHGHLIVRLDDVNFRGDGSGPKGEDPLQMLRWLGLDWDEGPNKEGAAGVLRTSGRLALYKEYVQKLLAKGAAYMCFATPEELEKLYIEQRIHGQTARYDRRGLRLTPAEREAKLAEGKPYVVRLKVPDHVVEIVDLVRGKLVYNGPEHADFVIWRSDGVPTRAFANVIDDHLMGITHVVRGEEDKAENPFQGFIANALELPLPAFVHLPLILAADKTRLSERHGAVLISAHRDLGYLNEAMLNYLATHGWDPGDAGQLRSLGSLSRSFHLDQIAREHSTWDVEKLKVFNRMAIEKLKDEALVELLAPYLAPMGLDIHARGPAWALDFVAAVRPGLATLSEVRDHAETYFSTRVEPDRKGLLLLKDPDALKVVNALEDAVNKATRVDKDNYREIVDAARGAITNRGKALVLTRVLLTGKEAGGEFGRLLPLLGKQTLLERLDYVRRHIPRGTRRG